MKHLFTKTNVAVLVLTFILGVIAFSIELQRNRSRFPNSFVMKYADFGPPGSPDELLGPESSKGDGQRAGALGGGDEMQVVVYRNIDLATVRRTYPELGDKTTYLYVDYGQAMSYLDRQIEELRASNNHGADYDKLEEKLVSEYERSRAKIIERLGP